MKSSSDYIYTNEMFYEEIYEMLSDEIEPHVNSGLLPPSVVESFDFLLEFYLQSLKENN